MCGKTKSHPKKERIMWPNPIVSLVGVVLVAVHAQANAFRGMPVKELYFSDADGVEKSTSDRLEKLYIRFCSSRKFA